MKIVIQDRKIVLKAPLGACCLDTGDCLDLTPDECDQIPGAVHQGPGSECTTAVCPAGACCPDTLEPGVHGYECIPTDNEQGCIDLPGTFFPDGICETRLCTFPMGPCTSSGVINNPATPDECLCWRLVGSVCVDCSDLGTQVATPCWVHDCVTGMFGPNVAFVVNVNGVLHCTIFTPEDVYERDPGGIEIFCPDQPPLIGCDECCGVLEQGVCGVGCNSCLNITRSFGGLFTVASDPCDTVQFFGPFSDQGICISGGGAPSAWTFPPYSNLNPPPTFFNCPEPNPVRCEISVSSLICEFNPPFAPDSGPWWIYRVTMVGCCTVNGNDACWLAKIVAGKPAGGSECPNIDISIPLDLIFFVVGPNSYGTFLINMPADGSGLDGLISFFP